MTPRRLASVALTLFAASGVAQAQAPGPAEAPGSAPGGPPAAAAPVPKNTLVTQGPAGSVIFSPLPERDGNSDLPSSSRPKVGNESDTFDFRQGGSGTTTVVGNPNGTAVIDSSGGSVRPLAPPSIHLVRRGDTLWDLSGTYYGNPWQWPRIWSKNPQIENPHWIYPGDQIRMGPGGDDGDAAMTAKGGKFGDGKGDGTGTGTGAGGGGLGKRPSRLTRGTVVLRNQGFIGDPNNDVWGEIAGSDEEQMMLAEGNNVYVVFKQGKTVRAGEELTIFRSVRQPDNVPGARKPPGELVAILGTVKLDSVDPKSNIAKARITESLDVIERGARIGPVKRKFEVVPPLRNEKQVVARVLTSIYPHVYVGQNQVVFLDHGSEDGLKPGNRMVVVRRGDSWRRTLSAQMTGDRLRTDVPEPVAVERTPLPGEDSKFPDTTVAELRILSTERYSSLAIVTQSKRELLSGDVAVARAGF